MIDVAQLTTELNLRDNLSPGLGRAMNSVRRFEGGMGRASRGAGQLAGGLGRLGTIAAGLAIGGFAASVKVASDFEAQLNTINTIAQQTPAQLEHIGEGLRDLSRETGASLDDLTTAYYDLLSAGVEVADAQGILEQSTLLATGTLGTTSQAVDVLTTALNAYNLPASEAARVSEELAVAVRDGKVTLDQIAPSYANVALTAANAGIETTEIAAAFAQLTAKGAPAAEVTTQMNRAILSLIAPNQELIDLQEELAVNFADIAREKGLHVALEELRVASEDAGIPLLDLLGRSEALKFALATTGPNFQQFVQQLERTGNSTGVLADQVSAKRQGLAYQMGILKASLEDVGITIGNAVLPVLTPLVSELSAFINENEDKIKAFARGVGDAIRDLVEAGKSGEFQPFIDALSIIAKVGGEVVDIFLRLPAGIQAALVTGAALNKLSGGQLLSGATNVVTGVGGAVFNQFLARGSSPANPMFVAGAGLGGPGGVGGKGGGVGGALLGGVGLAAIVAAIAGGISAGSDLLSGSETTAAKGAVVLTGGPGALIGRAIEDALRAAGIISGGDPKRLNAPLEKGQKAIEKGVVAVGSGVRAAAEKERQDNAYALRVAHNADLARRGEAVNNLRTLSAQSVHLQQIARKNFSPTINVTVPIKVSGIIEKTAQYSVILGTSGKQPLE